MGSAYNKRGFEFHKAGLNSVGSYQMSGVPFLSSSIQVPAYNAGNGEGFRLPFPSVTKSITIRNDGSEIIWLGFSATAISGATGVGGHRISLPSSGSFSEDFRITDVWLISDTTNQGKASVIGSLTGITRDQLANNWADATEINSGLV